MKSIINSNSINNMDNNIMNNIMWNLLFMKDNTNLWNNYKKYFWIEWNINNEGNNCFKWELNNCAIEYNNINNTIDIKSNINNLNNNIEKFNKDMNLMNKKILENNKILNEISKIYQEKKDQDNNIEEIKLKKGYIKYDIQEENLYITFKNKEYNLENILEELKNS